MAGSMYKETIVGKTRSGKEVAFRVKEGESLRTIYFVGGGQLPPSLQGKWTDERQIRAQVTAYLNKDNEPLVAPEVKQAKEYKKAVSAAKKRTSKLKQPEKESK